MTGKITRKFRQHNAEQFYEAFSETANSNMYFFIAKPTAWPNDSAPTAPLDAVNIVDYDIWDHMISLKKISSANVKFGGARTEWANNSTFGEYASNAELDEDFFAVTDEYKVYKVISNKNGSVSTVKPTGNLTTQFVTADGYVWKYMYSLTVSDALSFLTSSYMPIPLLTSDDGTDQWDVQQAAANGSINSIHINNGGIDYVMVANTFGAAANSTHATLAASSSSNNSFFIGSSVYVETGTGAGQIRSITSYDGASKIIGISPSWTTPPSGSSTYIVSPKVTVIGNGSNATAYSLVANNAISQIRMVNTGQDYSLATTTVTANTGSGALVAPQLSPVGGHGSNAVRELYGHNVIMSVEVRQDDTNFMATNDYRIVGLVVDPVLSSNGSIATGTVYDQTTRLTFTTPTGSFTSDEVITGQTTGATGTFVEFRGNTSNIAVVLKTSATNFSNTEIITGGTSTYSATLTASSAPELAKYSGNIIYFENRTPITRSAEQKETVKIVVRF